LDLVRDERDGEKISFLKFFNSFVCTLAKRRKRQKRERERDRKK